MGLVADRLGEFIYNLRIVEIFFLRGDREQQMILHEPCYEPGVVAAHTVLETESLRIYRT